jgi:4-azaleucine resistance transporter AzlC
MAYKRGVRLAAPLAAAVGVFGISYGVLARAAGMGAFAPIAMSATTFGGSAQFAAASILRDHGGAAAAIAAALLLNLRYLPIGISVARGFIGPRTRRLAESQLVVDESWAIALGAGRFDRRLLIGAGALLYGCWVGGTAIGVIGGGALGDPSRYGLDAAFPALFLALVAPRLRERRALAAAALGGVVAAGLVPLVPPGIPIVAASGACLLGWRRS